MGLNSEHARRIVFDLETAPLLDAADYLVEPIQAPSNWKDPEAIARYIADAKAKQLEKCSLDPDLCRIVALGWQVEGDEPQVRICRGDDYQERDAINEFWNLHFEGDPHLVGYDCIAFDLPVLLRRALYLDAARPVVQIDRFRHPQVTDLMQVLSFNGSMPWHSLSFYCKRMGIDVPDTLTGADIGAAVVEERWEDVRAHCQADVQKTAALAARLGLFSLTPAVTA